MTVEEQAQKKAQFKKSLIAAIRFFGAVLILLGVAAIFDLGGITRAMGPSGKILGGVVLILGIVDYLALPAFLNKAIP